MNNQEYSQLKSEVINNYKTMSKELYLKYKGTQSNELRLIIFNIISNYVIGRTKDVIVRKRKRKTITKILLDQQKTLMRKGVPELLNF